MPTEFSRLNREASRFGDYDLAAPWSSSLHKAVLDATVFDPEIPSRARCSGRWHAPCIPLRLMELIAVLVVLAAGLLLERDRAAAQAVRVRRRD